MFEVMSSEECTVRLMIWIGRAKQDCDAGDELRSLVLHVYFSYSIMVMWLSSH